MNSTTEIADRLAAATAAHDIAAMDSLLHPLARVWHNTDNAVQSKEQAMIGIAAFYAATAESRYSEIRRREFAGGFVQQHVLQVRFLANGPLLEIPCCIVVEITDDQISAIDEYLDPAPFDPRPN